MKIGIIGVGRMGEALVYRTSNAGFEVVVFDVDTHAAKALVGGAVTQADSLEQLAQQVSLFWLMIPAAYIDQTLAVLLQHAQKGSVIIDGGNSKFTDSIDRAQRASEKGMSFIDCGTSGGLHGREIGFSLMIGGSFETFTQLTPVWNAVAAPNGYAYMGRSGSGHYVKMVHNGIEYGLLQAYAEGFNLIKHGSFKDDKLNLETITRVWQHGSIIRSWILHLSNQVFTRDQDLEDISGVIGQLGTGKWTVEEAHRMNIPVDCIERAVHIRNESEKTGGNYATKVVALLRKAFGGHALQETSREKNS